MKPSGDRHDTRWIRGRRGPKNALDPREPYAYFAEPETAASGEELTYAIILITNKECPFTCLMCDLWKNTLDHTVPAGAITEQIRRALASLPPVDGLKLYNAGSFFDRKAIPSGELPQIAAIGARYRKVIVEAHPAFIDDSCLDFAAMLGDNLEVAIGLETVHPQVLHRLNKSMTMEDFERSVRFLTSHRIPVRAFILLRPPFLSEREGVEWAKRSIEYAQDLGVECCVIIPTRDGNGALEELARQGAFGAPHLSSLEEVVAYGVERRHGRVFADTWDLERLPGCALCRERRLSHLASMNRTQATGPVVRCEKGAC